MKIKSFSYVENFSNMQQRIVVFLFKLGQVSCRQQFLHSQLTFVHVCSCVKFLKLSLYCI
jgi:hypothetical protein